MYILGNFIAALATVVDMALTLVMWMVIIRALLSWVSPDPYNPIVRALNQLTDPLFYKVKRYLPVSGGGIDFSPIVILMAIIFLQSFLVRTLKDIAMQLQ
ncbi:MAG: YggT family protein [Nitrospinae bacterium]|nr:YggT family protein [Nitrospinota bacterium]